MSKRMQEIMIESDNQKVNRCKSCYSPNTEIVFNGPNEKAIAYTLRLTAPHSWLKCKDCQNLSVHETIPTGTNTGGEIVWFNFGTSSGDNTWTIPEDLTIKEYIDGDGRRK